MPKLLPSISSGAASISRFCAPALAGAFQVSASRLGQTFAPIAGTSNFPDLLGIGATPALVLGIFGEILCSLLLIVGLWTRLAALMLAMTMSVAFFVAHGAKLSDQGSGELAFVYLAGYAVLLLAGAGKISVDRK